MSELIRAFTHLQDALDSVNDAIVALSPAEKPLAGKPPSQFTPEEAAVHATSGLLDGLGRRLQHQILRLCASGRGD